MLALAAPGIVCRRQGCSEQLLLYSPLGHLLTVYSGPVYKGYRDRLIGSKDELVLWCLRTPKEPKVARHICYSTGMIAQAQRDCAHLLQHNDLYCHCSMCVVWSAAHTHTRVSQSHITGMIHLMQPSVTASEQALRAASSSADMICRHAGQSWGSAGMTAVLTHRGMSSISNLENLYH